MLVIQWLAQQRFLRFLIMGGLAGSIDLLLLYFFTSILGLWYIYSGILSFGIVSIISFVLHKRFTFKNDRPDYYQQYFKFSLVILGGMIINNGLLFIFTQTFGLWYIFSRILSSLIAMSWNYFNNAKRVFV